MIEKPKVLKCTLKVLENRSTFEMYLSTFEMYLSTSTSTEDFPEMYLSTFQVLYKLYLSTDVLKYKVLLPGSDYNAQQMCCTVKPLYSEQSRDPKKCSLYRGVHPRGVRYVHVHMCLQYTKNGSVLASKGLIRW